MPDITFEEVPPPEPPPWTDDERVPCCCYVKDVDGGAEAMIGRAPVWITEHWLSGFCPRHRPLDSYRDRITEQLAQFDATP